MNELNNMELVDLNGGFSAGRFGAGVIEIAGGIASGVSAGWTGIGLAGAAIAIGDGIGNVVRGFEE